MNGIRIRPLFAAICVFSLFFGTSLFAAESGVVPESGVTTGALVVKVNVTDVSVYLDGGIIGTGSVTVNSLAPGLHQLTVLKDGYYTESMTVRIIAGETTTIRVNLVAMTGTIEITGIPDGTAFIVIIGDKEYSDKKIEVAEDNWVVTIRVFGFMEQTSRASVRRRRNTVIEFKGEPAAFGASSLYLSKRSFNPDNPEKLGTVDASFTVTAPGTGSAVIRNGSGTEIRTIKLKPFTAWKQNVAWNGTDELGASLPDGTYSINITATSADGQTTVALQSNVSIDRSIAYPFTGTASGLGATGPVISASLLPARSIEFGVDGHGYAGEAGAGMSIVAGLTDAVEAGAHFAATINGDEDSAADFSLGVKAGTGSHAFRVAAVLRWQARTTLIDGNSGRDRNGIGFGIPLEYRAGIVTFGVFPSIAFGNELGLMNNAFFTAGAGTAIRADVGNFFFAAYGNANTGAFGGASSGDSTGDFKPIGSWSAGASAKTILPATSVVLSLEGGYASKVGERGSAYASGGISVLF